MENLILIVFLVLSCGFVGTLIMSIFKLIGHNWTDADKMGGQILNMFKWPLIFFVLFLIWVLVVLPRIS